MERPYLPAIQQRLRRLADPDHARILQRFFKTGPGEYGEGDLFLGIKVPVIRKLAAEFRDVPVDDACELLASPHHEARLLALLLLVSAFNRGDEDARERVYRRYLASSRHINNWDLVDTSAPHIVGGHLIQRDRAPLDLLARSASLWERRIAIMATLAFIRANEFADTFRIVETLLPDRHDLIHKAAGWMLREIGKRDQPAEEAFLLVHHRDMPRTMLRYAIERFPEERRRQFLHGTAR